MAGSKVSLAKMALKTPPDIVVMLHLTTNMISKKFQSSCGNHCAGGLVWRADSGSLRATAIFRKRTRLAWVAPSAADWAFCVCRQLSS